MPTLPPRVGAWIAAALLAIHAVLAWLARGPGLETGRDDAMYLQLARSLRQLSYRELWLLDSPLHVKYPPVYPALLALTGLVTGERLDVFLALQIGASVFALYLAYRVVARLGSPALGLLVLVALVPNPVLLVSLGQVASEPLFMLLSVGAVAALAREEVRPRDRVLAGALAIAAALTRSVGVSLVVATLLLWLLERRWKAATAFAAASALTVGAWLGYTVVKAERVAGVSYVGDALTFGQGDAGFLGTHLESIASQLARYGATTIPEALAVPTVPGTIIDNIFGAALVTVGLIAGVLQLWRSWRAAAVYLVCALGLLMIWPYGSLRFVAPLLPLLAAALLVGIERLASLGRPRWGLAAAAMLAAVLAVTGSMAGGPLIERRRRCERGSWPPALSCVSPDQASFFAAGTWIREQLPPEAVVASTKFETLAYVSGRRSVPARRLLVRDSTLPASARDAGALWILLGSLHWSELGALRERLTRECAHLAVVRKFPPRTYLFRISDQALPDNAGCQAMADYRRENLGRDLDRGP